MLRKQKNPIHKLNESGIQPKEITSSYRVIATLKKEYTFVQHSPYESAETTVGLEVGVLLVHYHLCDYLLKTWSLITESKRVMLEIRRARLVIPDR